MNIMTRSLGGGGQIMTNHHDIFMLREDPKCLFRGFGTAFVLHYSDLRSVQKIVKISRRKVIILTCVHAWGQMTAVVRSLTCLFTRKQERAPCDKMRSVLGDGS